MHEWKRLRKIPKCFKFLLAKHHIYFFTVEGKMFQNPFNVIATLTKQLIHCFLQFM